MPTQLQAPVIDVSELPDFDNPVALHGARIGTGASLGMHDDLWIIAIIAVYEK